LEFWRTIKINPTGNNFVQEFNNAIKMLQMTSIVPQMVNIGSSNAFDSGLKDSLYALWEQYKDSLNKDLKEQAARAYYLWSHESIRRQIYKPLKFAQTLGGPYETWDKISSIWTDLSEKAPWFRVMEKPYQYLKLVQTISISVMMFLPLFYGHLENTPKEMWLPWLKFISLSLSLSLSLSPSLLFI
jgi:hypothetical protein